jgi:DNA primase
MPGHISKEKLRSLRNDIPVARIIEHFLNLPCKISEGYFRFLCPLCSEFTTAVNPKTNLARCFGCEKNFNPIDMVIAVDKCSFKEAVVGLEKFKAGL